MEGMEMTPSGTQESNSKSRSGGSIQSARKSNASNEPKPQTKATDDSGLNVRPTQSTINQFNLQGTSSPVAPPPNNYVDSTQVLVPIHPLPEESELRVGPRTSAIRRHTIPMESESVMGTNTKGLRIHRNQASVGLENLQMDSNTIREIDNGVVGGTPPTWGVPQGTEGAPVKTSRDGAGDPLLGGLGNMFGGVSTPVGACNGEFQTLVDEMACHVAGMADDVYSYRGYFQQAYKTFSDLAKTAASKITASAQDGGRGASSRAEPGEATRANGLPPEVRDRIVHSLDAIKVQLSTVKSRIKK